MLIDDKEESMNGKIKKIFLSGLAVSIAFANVTAFASPSFTRSAEEWARLRDNKLEYDELSGLIEEYNPTVRNSERDYIKFRKDYGNTNQKTRDEYRKAAQDILASISTPDPDSPSYISTLTANANARAQAESLLNSADNSLEDALIKKLTNDSATKTLIWNAQTNMVEYYTNGLEIEKAKLQKELAEINLSAANVNLSAGAGTKVDVLNANDAFLKSEQSILSSEAAKEKSKKKLQVMTGWTYEAEPEFGEVPKPQLEKIAGYNPTADLQAATDNNYALKIDKRKLENASSDDAREKLNETIANDKSGIAVSLNNAYAAVLSAKANYDYAVSNLELQKSSLAQAERKTSLGLMGQNEFKQAQINEKQAVIALDAAQYNLLNAMQAYEWNVNGLASTGAK